MTKRTEEEILDKFSSMRKTNSENRDGIFHKLDHARAMIRVYKDMLRVHKDLKHELKLRLADNTSLGAAIDEVCTHELDKLQIEEQIAKIEEDKVTPISGVPDESK